MPNILELHTRKLILDELVKETGWSHQRVEMGLRQLENDKKIIFGTSGNLRIAR